MAFIKDYYSNRALYDVYDYPSDPPASDVDLNASLRSKIFPTGYNQNCGWPHDPENGIDYGIVNAPFRRLNNRILEARSLIGFESTSSPNSGANVNSFNSGWPTAVVISDRHIATCYHCVFGVSGTTNWMFIDNNGNTHEKYFQFDQSNSRVFDDTVVYKLRDDQTGFIDSNIPILEEIVDMLNLPPGENQCLYCRDQQGKFFTKTWFKKPDEFPESNWADVFSSVTKYPDYIYPDYMNIFTGDSGHPCWMKLKNGKFMFAGGFDGMNFTDKPATPDNAASEQVITRIKELCASEGSPSPMR